MGGQGLFLDARLVASYSPNPGVPYVLAYFHCGTARLIGKTYGSEATARAYIEASAWKWHAELRQEYARA